MTASLPRALAGCVAALSLAGCGAGPLVRPHEPVALDRWYRVDPQIEWSRMRSGRRQVWTVDGPQLEQLRLYAGIEPRETLLTRAARPPDRQAPRSPHYEAGMRAHDVAGLVAATLVRLGAARVEWQDLRPARFGDRRGFRFGLRFASAGGLAYEGLAAGTVADADHLHLIVYFGTRDHHFGAYEAAVAGLIESVEMIDAEAGAAPQQPPADRGASGRPRTGADAGR